MNINQEIIIEFANDILKNGFPISQLEIDDKWVTEHGDLTPDPNKFPDLAAMTEQLHEMGIKVTIWTHPFFNIESETLQETLPSNTFTDYDDEDQRDFYVKAGQERYYFRFHFRWNFRLNFSLEIPDESHIIANQV